VPTNDDEYGGM